ncbi:MAG: hypothetical protein J4473_00695 [Candidatus Aenigmarchaeota archaeon]|nr:hypothetical protein [Candidatus Aenigmarchaeota archaeon]
MLEYFLIAFVGFAVTVGIMPVLSKFLKKKGIVSYDKHKNTGEQIPEWGGLGIFIGFVVSMLAASMLTGFIQIIWISISIVFLCTVIGMLDYILHLMDLQKVMLPLLVAIPFVIIQPVSTEIVFPFIGTIDFGIWYYIVLVPLAITGACNAINMLAGLNGLEAGNSLVILTGSTILFLIADNTNSLVLSIAMIGPIIGFLVYNKYPAKIFPGDVGTFAMGGLIAMVAIFSKLEFFIAIMMIPQFIEFFLKLRSRFKAENFGNIKGSILTSPYTAKYSLTHFFYSENRFNEKEIVYKLWIFQAVFILLAVSLFIWGGFKL